MNSLLRNISYGRRLYCFLKNHLKDSVQCSTYHTNPGVINKWTIKY